MRDVTAVPPSESGTITVPTLIVLGWTRRATPAGGRIPACRQLSRLRSTDYEHTGYLAPEADEWPPTWPTSSPGLRCRVRREHRSRKVRPQPANGEDDRRAVGQGAAFKERLRLACSDVLRCSPPCWKPDRRTERVRVFACSGSDCDSQGVRLWRLSRDSGRSAPVPSQGAPSGSSRHGSGRIGVAAQPLSRAAAPQGFQRTDGVHQRALFDPPGLRRCRGGEALVDFNVDPPKEWPTRRSERRVVVGVLHSTGIGVNAKRGHPINGAPEPGRFLGDHRLWWTLPATACRTPLKSSKFLRPAIR